MQLAIVSVRLNRRFKADKQWYKPFIWAILASLQNRKWLEF